MIEGTEGKALKVQRFTQVYIRIVKEEGDFILFFISMGL